ncbi:hypothetical protein NNJEOMEG_03680 [Fundidesulfovibrio magnetotacticus]|uniref:Uncharacterized protein n=1 Tax=Fundidesulfovibrio magnetotacticus TaxID=2730080 RepID=A0A6V8LTM0_9BACT|nr:hypothetical protein [Fundidesulfovibrio magnetotacticus]GFK95812.1 hypothetical protein NNJEOMEG_03680 [Fundidesulfovibrio magnetotacticus]
MLELFRKLYVSFDKYRKTYKDRYLAYLSIYVGIIGIGISLILFAFDTKSINAIFAFQNAAIVCCSIFIIIYLIRRHNIFTTQLHSLVKFSRFICNVNNSIINKKNSFRFKTNRDNDALYSNMKDIFKKVTDDLRIELLSYYESIGKNRDNDLSVAIRLICKRSDIQHFIDNCDNENNYPIKNFCVNPKADLVIATCWRDWYTFKELNRSKITIYDIDQNTPYWSIIKTQSPYSCIYRCNDIAATDASFLCQNENWRKHYNATLVAPIKYPPFYLKPGEIPHSNHLGFITVDSKNAGKYDLFDDEIAQNLLRFVAGEMLDTIIAYTKLSQTKTPVDFVGSLVSDIIETRAKQEGQDFEAQDNAS